MRRGGDLRRFLLLATVALVGCGGAAELPSPRPLIIHSGARLAPDAERLAEVDRWVRPQLETIERDPSFLIRTLPHEDPVYPWEGLSLAGDTVDVQVHRTAPDSRTPYLLYAHFHLMAERGELEEWLPEAVEAEGFELETAILTRVADSWLYGRSTWDAAPYGPLDELMYARESEFLEALILTARPQEFEDAREAWLEEDPGAMERYREWFVETFEREPPGLREEAS